MPSVAPNLESPPCVWGVPVVAASDTSVQQNHPHVYGEYAARWYHELDQAESPPCVWGVPI